MKEIFDRRYPVTSFFLLVTTLVFLLMLVTAGGNFDRADTLFRFGAMYGPAIRLFPEQAWRLFSAIFVHIGLLSGMMGNLFVFVFSPKSLAAGASTSLYGLFAAIIVLRYATRNPYIQQLGQSYLTLFVVNIIGSVLIPGISLAGHIGGAVGGAFLAVIFPVRGERRMYSASQRLVALVLFVGLAVLLFYKGMGL
ncbi:MAG: rhomboid family intramembrane serine protease [Streptococcus mitis]|nr:rhomboid family intramembrane serine protease [Streptococcus mitis]